MRTVQKMGIYEVSEKGGGAGEPVKVRKAGVQNEGAP